MQKENKNRILSEITELVAQFEEQKKIIFDSYVQAVSSVLAGNITAENEIERIMDGLLDFGDDENFLALYKKVMPSCVLYLSADGWRTHRHVSDAV